MSRVENKNHRANELLYAEAKTEVQTELLKGTCSVSVGTGYILMDLCPQSGVLSQLQSTWRVPELQKNYKEVAVACCCKGSE